MRVSVGDVDVTAADSAWEADGVHSDVAHPARRSIPPPPVGGYTKVFLVVDDDIITQRMMGRLIERYGYSYDIAKDGQEAVDLVKEGRTYCVMLMDNTMPRLTGKSVGRTMQCGGLTKVVRVRR